MLSLQIFPNKRCKVSTKVGEEGFAFALNFLYKMS